jgi:hypothetical protein
MFLLLSSLLILLGVFVGPLIIFFIIDLIIEEYDVRRYRKMVVSSKLKEHPDFGLRRIDPPGWVDRSTVNIGPFTFRVLPT